MGCSYMDCNGGRPVAMYSYLILSFLFSQCLADDGSLLVTYPGRNQPLGSHRPPEADLAERQGFPKPSEFYQEFVLKSRAVVFRGACKDAVATKAWSDSYLRKHYGNIQVSVDQRKVEERNVSHKTCTLSEFLDIYNKTDVYLIDTLPQEMSNDFNIPDALLCGGFTERLQDIVMWFSSGKSKSHLHMDTVENINCMVSGSKTWFLVDKGNTEHITMDHQEGDFCSVDVERVNMEKYPFLQTIPWWNVTMEQGDCVYIPYGWGHQVASHARNIAINVWWTPMTSFNITSCQDLPKKRSVNNFKFVPAEQYRFQLMQVLENNKGSVDFKLMHLLVLAEHTGRKLISKDDFKILDQNEDGFVEADEILQVSAAMLQTIFDGEQPGSVNIKGYSTKSSMETSTKEAENNTKYNHLEL